MRRRPRSWLLGTLPTIALLLALPGAAVAAPRIALVIGDAAYPSRPLATPANDAALVAQALAQAGFDVTAARDLDGTATRAAFAAFAAAARAAGADATILVYLAGYGVQYDNDNFLVPVDGRLVHDVDVPKEAVDLGAFARTLATVPAKARLIVYDVARTNPFATADEMPLADGLALAPPPKDTLVAFNAAPGMGAPPSALPYGAYARALAEMIGAPGLSPDTLFERVRLRVGELTDGSQVPWDDGTVDAAPLLSTGRDPSAGHASSIDKVPVDALSPDIAYSAVIARDSLAGYADFLRAFPSGPLSARVRTLLAVRREALIWQAAMQAGDARALWTYMRRYPHGPHRFDARRGLAALHAPLEPPPRFDIVAFPNLPPPTEDELKLIAATRGILRTLPPIPPPPDALLQPADADYYDALPPPAPPFAGLLPIAAPLPQAADHAGESGRITQDSPGKGPVVTETDLTQDGATLILADALGPVAEIAAKTAVDGSRTILETDAKDAKKAVLSRTTTFRGADGLTMVQTGAGGGVLYGIATRTDPDGARVTRVTSGRGELLATWRRDTQGIVVAHDDAAMVPQAATGEPSLPTAPALHGHTPPAQAAREPALQPPPPFKPSGAPVVPPPPMRPVAPTPLVPSAPPTLAAPRTASAPPPKPAAPPPLADVPHVPPIGTPATGLAPKLTTRVQPGAKPALVAPEAGHAPGAAPAPPLPPHRPAAERKLQPNHASQPAHEQKHAIEAKHARAPKAKPAAKAKPASHASEAKHAPTARTPASHAGKPHGGASHRKAGGH